ncbi:uncharacterized protein Z518_03488 [Rhinocladiella mackenziei CBS 650.93]|uniref:PEBP-like protein n=1 Tax=Rhinocladiella mackenziei CBS 650.93 TaxID=1442369 RepID=A0A0D2IZH5_9EURO|nr:uncharacterized protein Z518_03488 [Rhinocladiella mackenziei CBS 650.93]KIX08831.1 hypothetical protein Z518_03488 [Rhinocladiella mackenziei CBS 650.93]
MIPWSIVSLFLAITPTLTIPPPDFGFPEAPNHTELSVTYQDNGVPIVVGEAELFGVGITAEQPTVAVETANYESISSYSGSYVLIMVDPDARYPSNPTSRFILHWLQTDMTPASMAADGTSQLMNSTAPRVSYRRPSPPPDSSAHRYIIYTFFQHENFTFPSAFEGYSETNRSNFNITTFLDESNLGQSPAAAMYYFASNQTQVPQDFTAAGGGTYPGGNGDMITAGPGPSPTPASSSAVTTSSGSGSAMPSSGSSSGSETASATGSAASTSDTNAAGKIELGTGVFLAFLMAILNSF